MKTYLFSYSNLCPPWQAHAVLNDTNAVVTWAQPLPNAAVIVSNLDVQDLAAVFRRRLGETWFLITELNAGTVDGYLPANLWSFINSAQATWQPHFPGTALTAS